MKRALRSLALGLAWVSIWPTYLVLLAQAARLGPWPRNLGILGSTVLHGLALGALIHAVVSWLTRRDGWAERFLDVPPSVCRQVNRAGKFLSAAAAACLIPAYLLTTGEIAPDGRPVAAPAFARLFVLAFELAVWGAAFALLRRGSPLMRWCDLDCRDGEAEAAAGLEGPPDAAAAAPPPAGRAAGPLVAWISRRRALVAWTILASIAGILALDARGYRFTARRLASGATESLLLFVACWATHRGLGRILARHARGALRPRRGRAWASVLTTAARFRPAGRVRVAEGAAPGDEVEGEADDAEELAGRLRQLAGLAVGASFAFGLAWVWELDIALLRFLAGQRLWSVAGDPVTLGDLVRSAVIMSLGGLAWRHMGPLLSVTMLPRIQDDPGVRYAIVTLCRYAALGVATIAALGAIHVGTAQIGMVLAALGVGLGFGLQEIVSNFVCGIILLLERPIRIGDVVTVGGTNGKVDRINIRATTIINGDNQSMIVPNREFITGNLVNWTHKDKILRVSVRVGVAYGTDPERVVELLLAIARDDPEALRYPVPSALLEELGDSALKFVLHAYVPDPSAAGRVKHRLGSEIHDRFAAAGIAIPYPTQELHLARIPDGLARLLGQPDRPPTEDLSTSPAPRRDPAATTPPPSHLADRPARPAAATGDGPLDETADAGRRPPG
ncbi:Mechanosensitive channel MscK precursor [Aquisphaera giovannonii]|uniref:Mechanosensitive channel MscK n=1 Tax=Aquisphaera giovannonii TaxID=406548 RepID=A0A5B9W6D3_9BACT|nr:mechanosensitive ion channel domain-containing protein [Aquisphaera giovannonii]QEH36098.1 Mechanosensitive channel MscK precursor [Aquisphaera giovannonii]